MQISLDAGGLCVNQGYGNYIFSINILRAIALFDRTNTYTAYTFCRQSPFQNKTLFYKKLLPKFGFMKLRVSFEEYIHKKDIFLAIDQALPHLTKAKIIAFSHGLSFIHYPNLYKSDFTRLKNQLDDYLKKSYIIVTTSTKVKDDLYQYYPNLKNRVFTILPGIPYDFESHEVRKRKKYLLFVGMNHPVKNVERLVKLFLEFKKQKPFFGYQLFLVGEFQAFALQDIRIFPKISRQKLKLLYQEASVYISMSHYESFNFPILEALSQNCTVVALESAVIPEMQPYINVCKTEKDCLEALYKISSKNHKNQNFNNLDSYFSQEKRESRLLKF